jgi:hypothetical protein
VIRRREPTSPCLPVCKKVIFPSFSLSSFFSFALRIIIFGMRAASFVYLLCAGISFVNAQSSSSVDPCAEVFSLGYFLFCNFLCILQKSFFSSPYYPFLSVSSFINFLKLFIFSPVD